MAFKKGNIPWNTGKKCPEETKEKIIKAIKEGRYGMTRKKHSEETKKLMSKRAIGRKQTLETKNKISKSSIGKIFTDEHRKNLSLAGKGRKKTEECIQKIIKSKAHIKGKTYEEIYGIEKANSLKAKLRIDNGGKNNSMFGKTHTEEAKKRISTKNSGRQSWNKGGECSEDIKKYLSEKFKGEHHSPNTEFKKGHKTWITGKTHSPETKEKLRIMNSGKNNNRWRGGISFEPYDAKFNKQFKRAIRKRDNQICMLCNIHKEKLKRALDIHHINYNKQFSIPENCISLCQPCHMKANSNREHWTKFFQSLLSEKYNYDYSDDGEIIKHYDIQNIGRVN